MSQRGGLCSKSVWLRRQRARLGSLARARHSLHEPQTLTCRVRAKPASQQRVPIAKTSGDASQPAATGIAFVHGRAPMAFLAIRCMARMIRMAGSLTGVVTLTAAGAIVAKNVSGM